MVIGSLEVRLLLRQSRTLKDKRQVVRSVLDRVRARFNASAAEVGCQDDVKVAELGFAVAAADAGAARTALNGIEESLRCHPVAEYLGGELTVGSEVV